MYKQIVFCPYFGKLPNNFDLWSNSCSFNKNTKFVIFTNDNRNFDLPNNVEIIRMSFEELKNKIQKKFNFKISLNNPYKLCDYKPAYGYIFDEYIDNELYWGHCDLDMIFGDIEKFFPTNDDYDKISYLGHLCFYKNNEKVKKAFMLKGVSNITYFDIFSNDIHFGFDEIGDYGINKIMSLNNFLIYNYESYIADITCKKSGMVISVYDSKSDKFHRLYGKRIFSFENGKIFSYDLSQDGIISKKEYAYIHFQKRKMINKVTHCNDFIVTPFGFQDIEQINKKFIE